MKMDAILVRLSALYNLAVYAITDCNTAMTETAMPRRLERTRADLSEFLRWTSKIKTQKWPPNDAG